MVIVHWAWETDLCTRQTVGLISAMSVARRLDASLIEHLELCIGRLRVAFDLHEVVSAPARLWGNCALGVGNQHVYQPNRGTYSAMSVARRLVASSIEHLELCIGR